jgi:hypothetical protein
MLRVEHRAIDLGVKVTRADDALAGVVHGHLSGEEDQLSGLGDGDVVVARCRMQLVGRPPARSRPARSVTAARGLSMDEFFEESLSNENRAA